MRHAVATGKASITVGYLIIRRVMKQNVVIREACYFFRLHTKFYPASCCQGQLHVQRAHQCGFRHIRSTTDQTFFIRQILERNFG